MKEIPLTQNKVALVDDADFEWLSQWKWHAIAAARSDGTIYYRAVRSIWNALHRRKRNVYMHRQICGEPFGAQIDHRNRDSLDNRRSNLRAATPKQNNANKPGRANRTSGYKGVYYEQRNPPLQRPWRACINDTCSKSKHLGYFSSEWDAAMAYNSASASMFGEFAYLNELEAAA